MKDSQYENSSRTHISLRQRRKVEVMNYEQIKSTINNALGVNVQIPIIDDNIKSTINQNIIFGMYLPNIQRWQLNRMFPKIYVDKNIS